jgi:hypothetical protein
LLEASAVLSAYLGAVDAHGATDEEV